MTGKTRTQEQLDQDREVMLEISQAVKDILIKNKGTELPFALFVWPDWFVGEGCYVSNSDFESVEPGVIMTLGRVAMNKRGVREPGSAIAQ